MSHPDIDLLTRLAAGEAVGGGHARHVAGCPRCAAAVERLRAGMVGVRAAADARASAGCLDEGSVAALVDAVLSARERDSAVAHLAACPPCRVAVASLVRAGASAPVAHELARLEGRPAWLRYAVPVGAAAAVALLFFFRGPVPLDVPTHRDGAAPGAPAPVAISPVGATTTVRALRWHAVHGADRYRVTVYDDVGVVIYETISADTVAALPEAIELATGRPYYWIVAARTGFDRWDTSARAEFSTTSDALR